MFSLLHPAALWTLAALALPLAIHLRRPPPRTVRLGSLRFLENVPRRPLRNLRWRKLLLLCTRLGLLTALSILLAGPRWLVRPPPGARRWALLDPTAALAGESLVHWRTAQANGDELRLLVPGFPVVSNAPSPGLAAPDLWSLLREADAELPAGSTLDVFSPARLAALRGVRPALTHCEVRWVPTADNAGDTVHTWNVADAGQRLVDGHSDAHATTFVVRPRTDSAVDQPPSAVSVLILHDAESVGDARYVEAAVRAAADATGRPVNVQNRDITPDAENAAVADWTFWLSTRPVPGGLAGRAPRIVRYAGGDPVSGADRIVAPNGGAADGVALWKRALADSSVPAGTAVWRDGQGNPVLIDSRPAPGERWDFLTRFDPAWTDLPRTTALPAWMRALLFPEIGALAGADLTNDRRLADPAQSLPSDRRATTNIPALTPTDQPARDLHWPLWTLAALLFVSERVLSLLRRPAVSRSAASDPRPGR